MNTNNAAATATPPKGTRDPTNNGTSPLTRSSAKRAIKNQRITNFFPKLNSPQNRNGSDLSEYEQCGEDLSKEASSNSMKIPETGVSKAKTNLKGKDYVFIIPSSDDDTNASGKLNIRKRGRPPSLHSHSSKSSDSPLTNKTNSDKKQQVATNSIEKYTYKSRPCDLSTVVEKSSSHDSTSRGSQPEKKRKTESKNATPKTHINRIQPISLGKTTKIVDFQSIPSISNMTKEEASMMIEKLFRVKMPEDFFLFWEFAKTVNHRKPCSAFQNNLDWNLVGPFDVLSGLITSFHGYDNDSLFRHCRFYYDSPEIQTVIVKGSSPRTHYGYFRDDPSQSEAFLVSNISTVNCKFDLVGDNLFTLLKMELDSAINALAPPSQESIQFTSTSSPSSTRVKNADAVLKQSQLERAKVKQELTIIRDKLIDFCIQFDISCESWDVVCERKKNFLSLTLCGLGFSSHSDVVNSSSEKDLSKIKATISDVNNTLSSNKLKGRLTKEFKTSLNRIVKEQDECIVRTCLELGLNLFYLGDEHYHDEILDLLGFAYTQLGRPVFYDCLKAHFSDRRKGSLVSLLDRL